MNIKNSLLDYLRYKQLNGYSHVQRMSEEIFFLEWCPPGRKRKGRPQNYWMQEVSTGMREKEINNMGWIDKEEWRRK